jgi:hypothetical protein
MHRAQPSAGNDGTGKVVRLSQDSQSFRLVTMNEPVPGCLTKGLLGSTQTGIWECNSGTLPADARLKAIAVGTRTARRIKRDPDKLCSGKQVASYAVT